MCLQSLARLLAIRSMAVIGLIAAASLIGLSIDLDARSAQAQAAATATPRSASTPIAGVSITYTVKTGDSFNAIARQFNLTPQQLQTLNAITNTGVIRVGQVLIVAVSTFTPTPASTDLPAPTPTAVPTETPTPAPTVTPTIEPTPAPTSAPVPTDQPAATAVPLVIEPPAPAGIPVDVILVGAVMLFAVIGIVIGFRTQRG
ncbi:MAG: LysM peptidoglycan-binding domain-containing protein [Chloroflexi bacterium]|nr:LysM peptidoglycan-binding domain-containing protein [Chloroflexota bacterium]